MVDIKIMLYKIQLDFTTFSDPIELKETTLKFTLIELPKDVRINVRPQFFSTFLRLVDDSENYFHLSCIKEAIDSNGTNLKKIFMNFSVIFFTRKDSNKRLGVLITHDSDENNVVRAAWPMSFRDTCITNPTTLKKITTDLIVHPELHKNVNLLSIMD
ncbi:MAG: hypothetical protein ACTSVI_13150 [Promethearchaeota archaeon]